jgi:transposase-like protein DUF772
VKESETSRCAASLDLFKILVIQAMDNLSDERAEFLINNRMSFMRFLGLTLADWTCPRLVESQYLSLCFVLERYGACVAKGRMPADGIIKAIDISGDGICGLAA